MTVKVNLTFCVASGSEGNNSRDKLHQASYLLPEYPVISQIRRRFISSLEQEASMSHSGAENPAVILGGTENGLGVIRNLGREGIDVYLVLDGKDYAAFSRYCKASFIWPGVTQDPRRLRTFLMKLARLCQKKAVILPTSDLSVLNLSRVMRDVSGHYLAPISESAVLETLVVKRNFYSSLMRKGVPHPTTFYPDVDDARYISKRIRFPFLVKPSVSQIFSIRFGGKAFVANSNRELDKYLKLAKKHRIDVMIQELVPGPASNNYALDGYFDRHGRLAAFFPRRVLRIWPLSLGNSSACMSVPLSEVSDMKAITERYLASIGYRGIFNAHFKVDSRDGIPKLLEVNARSVGGGGVANTFPTACGVNLIFTAYLDALGEDITPTRNYKTGAYVLNSKNEIMWILAMVAQRKFSLREWFSTTAGKKHWTLWARDDFKPFIASYLALATDVIEHRDKILDRVSETEF